MNFVGGDSGSSSSSRRQPRQHDGGEGGPNSVEEDDDEERQNIGQFHPSSSSSSPSSSHLPQHQNQIQQNQNHQQTLFHPYHHHNHNQHHYHNQNQTQNHNLPGGWIQPSAMMVDNHNYPSVADDNKNNTDINNNSSSNNNNSNINKNDNDEQSGSEMMMVVEREHMFDKVVTPSDVGKLNRLVIPKQHAERYFPLDSSTNDKGLLLNFEDRNGKSWRFRYSYWNSSQSYVMTKGWSRFVKDKKLDAGDIVSFQRGVGGTAKDRLFIDWRHRPDAPVAPYHFSPHHQFSFGRNNIYQYPWNNQLLPQSQSQRMGHSNLMGQASSSSSYAYRNPGPYHSLGTGSIVNVNQGVSGSVIYFRSGGIPQQHVDMMQMQHQRSGFSVGTGTGTGTGTGIGTGIRIGMDPPPLPRPPSDVVFDSVPVVQGKAAAKRLRLFGVNMDCPTDDDHTPDYNQYDQFHHHDHNPPPSSSTIPYQQLKPYEEEEETTNNSSSSPMSLDLGM